MNIQQGFLIFMVVLIVIGGFMYLKPSINTSKSGQNIVANKENSPETLSVSPQTPSDKIIVESTTLSKDSYLVTRELIDGRLGQIVEISQPLKAGTHKDITISLGNADITGKELIVMVYDDQSSDGIFNDFDLPTIDENGNMIARYVSTGKPIPANLAEGDVSKMAHSMSGMASMEKVRYTGKSFTPEKIEVPAGSLVEFVNDSNSDMWVASAPHPSHTDLPTFDQFKTSKKGSVYRYIFDKKGAWAFHDHINPSAGGVVTVK